LKEGIIKNGKKSCILSAIMAHPISHTQTVPYGILCGFLLLLFGCQKTSNPPVPRPPVPPKPARATIVTTQVSGIHFDSAYAGAWHKRQNSIA